MGRALGRLARSLRVGLPSAAPSSEGETGEAPQPLLQFASKHNEARARRRGVR